MSNTYELGRIGLNLRGEYNSETAYEKLDVVTYNGSSYAAKASCTGVLPTNTASWLLLAQGNPISAITYADTLPSTGSLGQIVFIPLA